MDWMFGKRSWFSGEGSWLRKQYQDSDMAKAVGDGALKKLAEPVAESLLIEKSRVEEQQARELTNRRLLVDRQRQRLLTSAQVNPLFAPGSFGAPRKAPFSTPPITGERLG
jgi:hypothetical protein